MISKRTQPPPDATVTASGIARLAGVGRAAVSNWRRRYSDFPSPVGGPLSSPSFNAREVEDWLLRRGKLPEVTPELAAWRHIESYQPSAQIGDVLALAGAYLLVRSTRPETTARLLTPKQLATQLRTIDPNLAALIGQALPGQWDPHLRTVLQAVDELAHEQDPETTFEFLHSQYLTSAQSMSGLAGTPDVVASLMLSIAGPGDRILDFTCGTGSILRMAADRAAAPIRCFAQEINPQYARIAAIRLWFVHLRSGQADDDPPEIHVDDSLLADAYPDLRADVVAANFPFGIHDWGHDELAYDARWAYGVPPRTEPELAWVQHALAHLRPGGIAVVLMPPAAASRPAGRRIRAELVRRGTLRAVIALPAGLMPPTSIGLHIWVLVPGEPSSDQLLVVDASTTDRPMEELVVSAWDDFRAGRHTDLTGVSRAVPAIDVLGQQAELTPQRYLGPPPDRDTDPADTVEAIAEIHRLLAELPTLLPDVQPTPGRVAATSQVSLADLIRAGSMALLRGRTRNSGAADAVLTSADILSGGPPTGSGDADVDDEADRVRAGDVLFPVVGREVVARVATDEQIGAVPAPGVQILRVDLKRFDPWFVAGILSQDRPAHGGQRTSTTSSGSGRTDLRRLALPVLTLDEQRRYGGAFQQLAQFVGELERAASVGASLARQISNGLAVGRFSVPTTEST